jgi:hypothetical protein
MGNRTYWEKLALSTLLRTTKFRPRSFSFARAREESGKGGQDPTEAPKAEAASVGEVSS